jgi:hypothetical protein
MKRAIFEVASGPPLCAHVVAETVSVAASIVKALAYLAGERATLARGPAPCTFRGVIIQPPLVLVAVRLTAVPPRPALP